STSKTAMLLESWISSVDADGTSRSPGRRGCGCLRLAPQARAAKQLRCRPSVLWVGWRLRLAPQPLRLRAGRAPTRLVLGSSPRLWRSEPGAEQLRLAAG